MTPPVSLSSEGGASHDRGDQGVRGGLQGVPAGRDVPGRAKALIRNFVEGIEIVDDEAVLTYTIPMPSDGVTTESASVLDFVKSGPPN